MAMAGADKNRQMQTELANNTNECVLLIGV
jgi:hypothetical protein